MGGKGGGGGGGGYYAPPPSTSGYGSLEEAKATLARTAPLDLSQRQAAINAHKAARDASAIKVETPVVEPDTQLSEQLASTVLKEPKYWEQQNREAALKPRKLGPHGTVTTTQT